MAEIARQLLINPRPNEFKGLMSVSPILADGYGHVNNAAYLTLFEQQRARYIECAGFTLDILQEVYGLRAFLKDGQVEYLRQVFPYDLAMVHTVAQVEPRRHYIIFNQEMYLGDRLASFFDCTVWMVDVKGRPRPVPQDITNMINNATFLHPSRRPTTLILPNYMQ